MTSINEQLKAIDDELAKLENRKHALLAQKAALQQENQSQSIQNHEPLSATERINLFLTLFSGRSDVFALKWANQKTVKSGYSPACHNEWQKGICNKPAIKCSDCTKQNFKTFDEQEVYKHLTGPEFFKKQALRFSTHGTPRFISLTRIDGKYLSIPRGCEDDLIALLASQKIETTFDDKTIAGKRLSKLLMTTKLRKEQTKAVSQMVKHDIGILHAPTAFGKTVAAIGIIAKRKTNTLVLVHNKQLVEQWQERINTFTQGIKCGVHTGVKKSLTGQIDIATHQSLINRKDNSINPLLHDYGQIIIDECHHIPAASFELVLSECSAKYVVGLTATPNRQDGLQRIIFMLAGKVRHKVNEDSGKNFVQKVWVKSLFSELPSRENEEEQRHISEIYQWLVEDEKRNTLIVDDVISAANEGRHCLLLSERRGHADTLLQMLTLNGIDSVLLTGGMNNKERKAANENITKAQVIVATGKYVGEGFDLPRLDTLFITLPFPGKAHWHNMPDAYTVHLKIKMRFTFMITSKSMYLC